MDWRRLMASNHNTNNISSRLLGFSVAAVVVALALRWVYELVLPLLPLLLVVVGLVLLLAAALFLLRHT